MSYEKLLQPNLSNLFYYKGKMNHKFYSVGFVGSFKSMSNKIAWIVIRLCKRYNLKILQVSAPTSKISD